MHENYSVDKYDIDVVCNQTGCTRITAEKILKKNKGNLVKAIKEITSKNL
ncbi:UBA domain-containing protein [Nitrosopumilus sp.]|nr:UBA domain-containing protein [Nitrosopumilus sp.]